MFRNTGEEYDDFLVAGNYWTLSALELEKMVDLHGFTLLEGQRGLNLDMLMRYKLENLARRVEEFYVIMGLNSRTFAPELES